MLPGSAFIERVPLSAVDLADDSFRVSKKRPLDDLRASIERFGLLESPLLLKERDGMVPVFGHNRLAAAVRAGLDRVDSWVVETIDPADYRNRALLKCSRGEAGPVGRMKMALILGRLGAGGDELRGTIRHGFGVPDEFAATRMIESVLGLPASLREYLDARDAGFRLIRDLLSLPAQAHEFLGARIDGHGFRINIFREMVEMLSDILLRDGSLAAVFALPPARTGDPRREEQSLHDAVYAVRYPSYTAAREKAAGIVAEIERGACTVALPPYFEGGDITLSFRFARGETEDSIRRRLSGVDARKIEKLLGLL